MKLGFLTACLRDVPFDELVAWAAGEGFDCIELAAWPVDSERDHVAGHLDVARLDRDGAARARDVLAAHEIEISAMAYYDNNLHPDPSLREEYQAHLRKVIDAAGLLGVPLVGTFVGAWPGKP
ncbi:MAG: TIM barrel protein, partial [Rhodothermales bacterium]